MTTVAPFLETFELVASFSICLNPFNNDDVDDDDGDDAYDDDDDDGDDDDVDNDLNRQIDLELST